MQLNVAQVEIQLASKLPGCWLAGTNNPVGVWVHMHADHPSQLDL